MQRRYGGTPGPESELSVAENQRRVQARALQAASPADPAPAASASAGGAPDAGGDAQAVQAAAAKGVDGAGQALPHLDTIQEAFGAHDVSGVQAHLGDDAAAASASMGAEAYATGDDVAFGGAPSLHTAAHEAAHVVQQRAGVQLKGGVGKVGDSYEQHADQVADAVVAGESAEALLDQHAGAKANRSAGSGGSDVQRLSDGVDKLSKSAESHWYRSADGAKIVSNFRALPQEERNKVARDSGFSDVMRKVVKALNAFQMTQLFAMIPRSVADLRWKLYWLIVGGQISGMSIQQWRWFLVYNDASDWAELRNYPDGYKGFLKHCPAELVPPWDLLQGLQDGQWTGSTSQVRDAVNQLNADQKAAVLADEPKVKAIVLHAGDSHQTYRTLSYLNADIATLAGHLSIFNFAQMTNDDWGAMFGSATRAEVDDLAANHRESWLLVQLHCPPAIIAVSRGATQQVDDGTGTGTDESNINNQLDDPIQLDAMLRTMGPTGFLSLCCSGNADAAGNYAKVKAAKGVAGVTAIITALQPGQRMGDRTTAHLKEWFLAESSSVPISEAMFSKRFNVTAGGTGAYNHNTGGTTIGPWSIAGLKQSWTVLERLPPSNVENNIRLVNMLRDTSGGDGGAYYGSLISDPNNQSGEVVMGYQNLGAMRTDGNAGPGVYSAGGQGAGSAAVNMNLFNATLRHEIGHAVDRQLGVMDNWGSQESAGAWQKHDSYADFVDAIITAGGGLGTRRRPKHGYIAADVGKYRAAMIRAVSTGGSFQSALTAIKSTASAAPDAGPISAVFQTNRWTGGGSGPWYNVGNYKPQNDRSFQRAYGDDASLYSFKDSVRASKGVTQYQWRAPGEWFAEVYQVYYAEQENGDNAAVGGLLRARDPNAAEMMSTVVDRGFSPQDMRGGKVEKAPGT